MDITTIMMNSMPQSTPTPAGGVGGQVSQAGVSFGNGQIFRSFLATSLQTQQPLPTPSMAVVMEPPLMDLTAVMELLPDATERGGESTELGASGIHGMSNGKALSVMQLLHGLKALLENYSDEAGGFTAGESQKADANILADIRALLGNEDQLMSELEETLHGRINPAVIDRESLIEAQYKEATGQSLDEHGSGEQLAQLLNAVNALLPLVAGRNLDKKVVEGEPEPSKPLTVPVAASQQQNAAQTVIPDSLSMKETIDSEGKILVRRENAVIGESGEFKDSSAKTSDSKIVDTMQRDTQQPLTAQNKGLKIQPVAFQMPESDANRTGQSQESSDVTSIEILVKGEESLQELPRPAVQKPEAAISEKRDMTRTETVLAVPVDAKQPQTLSDRPVAEEPVAISREQIVSQVREKIAEHRIMQDNGQITIRLNPAELGELKISVRMDDQRLRVEIVAENRTVKDALMENLGSLKEALARQNLEVKQFDVSTGSRQFFNQGFREGRQQDLNQVASRQAGWLTGRTEDSDQAVNASWQPRENSLLDMMM